MKDEVWIQCRYCGHLHRVESNVASISNDDLYTEPIWCPCCRDETKHLNCYADETEIYYYYNANLDPRMY